jgi:hypothetical protein
MVRCWCLATGCGCTNMVIKGFEDVCAQCANGSHHYGAAYHLILPRVVYPELTNGEVPM